MQKRKISQACHDVPSSGKQWLDLERLADVELTSEDPVYPIENALLLGQSAGWRAADAGEQTIRLLFAEPIHISRIWLSFVEQSVSRTQEFLLRWSPYTEHPLREIVRQQWNFSPQGATTEIEDLRVDLSGVTVLELTIIPDIGGGDVRASLAQLCLA